MLPSIGVATGWLVSSVSDSFPADRSDLSSRSARAALPQQPVEVAHALALELLLRVWQRSDDGPLRRACGLESLLLVELLFGDD